MAALSRLEGDQVTGDPARLQQVVWNLLSNAVKFTSKGGRIQVLLERINSHLSLSVSDNGVGIDGDFLPNVFERFRQADQMTTRTFGGMGLGLSIVKHLVELHGGTVEAKSPGPGQGATFIVTLPVSLRRQTDQDADQASNDGDDLPEGTAPREDGYSLIRSVQALPDADGGTTPAAAVTALARSEDRRRALLAGFQTHVAKPVDVISS